jgi:type IV secretion system protein VirB5
MTRQSRVVPFVIALDGNRPVSLGQAQQVTEGDRRLVGSALFSWLQDLRNVTSDPIAQRRAIDRVYTHIAQGSQAQRAISDWYRASPPFERSRTATVSVEIRLILPVSDKTFQLEWMETTHDAYGAVKSRDAWKGSFVTAREVPTDEQILRQNPLGIYVVEANWNKVL